MKFAQWMKEVDALSESTMGIPASHLEDYHWRDSFEDGLKPGEALYDFLYDNNYISRYPEVFENHLDDCEVI